MTSNQHSELPADYRDLAELYREVCAKRDALVEQFEAVQKQLRATTECLRGMLELDGYRPRDGSVNEDWEALILNGARGALYQAERVLITSNPATNSPSLCEQLETFQSDYDALSNSRDEMASLLDWIEDECERMEEYHTGFRWISRRIVGLKVDAGDSFPAMSPGDAAYFAGNERASNQESRPE